MNLNEYIASVRSRRIGVIGAGVSNRPLIEALCRGGCDVTVCDRAEKSALGAYAAELEAMGAKLVLGEGYLDNLDFDLIFRTPGVLPHTPQLAAAKARGAEITSEMELFFRLCPCRTIAVTGSDGKTTTTTLIAEILRTEGYKVWLGGNIGNPLLTETADMSPDDFAVLELSSFQLDCMSCSPDVAIITNVSPNHLDKHPSYEDYIDAKKNIFLNQRPDSVLVLNADNAVTSAMAPLAKGRLRMFSRRERVGDGFYAEDGTIYEARGGESSAMVLEEEIRIPGKHNVENYMAAFCATADFAGRKAWRTVAKNFTGVEHRLELVRTLRGVDYYNDSIASSPTRTIAGLMAFDRKPVLIAGGYDKNLDYTPLGEAAIGRVTAMFLTGATAEKIRAAVTGAPGYDAAELPVFMYDDFDDAVRAASEYAQAGDMVLLSPASASFDHFKNFAERGEHFKKLVREMD